MKKRNYKLDFIKSIPEDRCWFHYVPRKWSKKYNLRFDVWYNKGDSYRGGSFSLGLTSCNKNWKPTVGVCSGQVVTIGMLINALKIPREDILAEIEQHVCTVCTKVYMSCEKTFNNEEEVCSIECLHKLWDQRKEIEVERSKE